MEKVYIVTSGEYDDYFIEQVFSDRKSAELYCASQSVDMQIEEKLRIEEYEVSECKDVDKYTIYRGVWFTFYKGLASSGVYYHIGYSKDPIEREIKNGSYRDRIKGVIPLDDGVYDYDGIYDLVCKEWDKLKEAE